LHRNVTGRDVERVSGLVDLFAVADAELTKFTVYPSRSSARSTTRPWSPPWVALSFDTFGI
jgi:hypothetical protein